LIPFVNLARQHDGLRIELEAAIGRVLSSCEFVLGRHVAQFEESFAAWCGAGHGIGMNSGTSALHVALLATGVGPGDEVITSAFTFTATASAIASTGARPVLVDIDPQTLAIDPTLIERAVTARTRGIVPVHLYGHPADMDPILSIARENRLWVIEDAAQAHGAEYKGRRVGSLSDAACFSFYPTKNLGACGEAGIIVTGSAEWARNARALRDWGEAGHGTAGSNFRMAAIQAAVLDVKLRHLEEWNRKRQTLAELYSASVLGEALTAPVTQPWAHHVFHIFAVRARNREDAIAAFRERGIETRIHYPIPIHLMNRFRALGYSQGDFPEAERASREVLSIPVYPELTRSESDRVAEALRALSVATDPGFAQAAASGGS